MRESNSSDSTLPALVGVAILAMLLAALVSIGTFVVLDRYGRSTIVVVEAEQPTIVAQITGPVATPGTYSLPADARLGDLVSLAGGLNGDADLAQLNMAARIGDGEAVDIPAIGRATPAPVVSAGPSSDGGTLVNINAASQSELEELPRIGPVIAGRIVDHREGTGPFRSVEELVEIEGISTGLLEDLRPLITVDE